MQLQAPMKQQTLVRIGFALILAAAWFAEKSSSAPENLKAYSVQMHLHGSMSEGTGSMRGANVQAKKVGLDVLWWTDHDWRIAYHTYAEGYDFEADGLSATRPVPYPTGTENAGGEEMQVDLTPHPQNAPVVDKVARISSEQANDGKKSLEIAAASNGKQLVAKAAAPPDPNDDGESRARGHRSPVVIGDYQSFFYEIDASRRRMKRSLASRVTLDIALWPDFDSNSDGIAGVRVDLSQQPPDMQQNAIFYVVTGLSDAQLRKLESAHVKFVRLDFKPRQWNRLTLHLTDDARRLGLGGEDNALVDASFGVLSRGVRVRCFFDSYRIVHQIKSEPLRAEAWRMAKALEQEFGTINYVSQELSYQAHLNPFGEHVPMIDYVKHPAGLSPRETVEFVHANGGVVSINHIFGTSKAPKGVDVDDPKSARAYEDKRYHNLLAEKTYGADILEVGYPSRVLPMASFLRVWDELSKEGVYIAADGVSDTHSSTGGWFNGNNFVTWIWARSKSVPDLVDGIRRGAMYFGNPVEYKGELRLTTDDGHQMGQIVVTQKPEHNIRISISKLPAGAQVRTVTNGVYGETFTTSSALFESTVKVPSAAREFFRVEVYTADDRPLVFSNPIYFRPDDADGISSFKRTVCK
jgi:hypothetical protein